MNALSRRDMLGMLGMAPLAGGVTQSFAADAACARAGRSDSSECADTFGQGPTAYPGTAFTQYPVDHP